MRRLRRSMAALYGNASAVCGFAALSLALMTGEVRAEDAAKPADKKVTYADHVQPILRQRCFSCHNPDKKTNGLDLTTYSGLMTGGASGEVVSAGSADDSYLYMLVSHASEPYMPPKSDKLPDGELAIIKGWIDGGALETAGSKVVMKKPKANLSLSGAPTGRPEGPPPMPGHLDLEPIVRTSRSTAITALATNPWSPLAAVGGQEQVLLYNTKTFELLGVLPFPEGVPEVLKFSQSGKLLLAGGGHAAASGRVVVWNLEDGERIIEVGDELDTVLAADISADQKKIALGGPSKIVRIYSTSDGQLLQEIKKHTDWVYSVAFSPDGVLLATADRNGGLFVWETETARQYLDLRGHTGPVPELSWRSDSNILASGSEDGSIRLWEMENGNQVKTWNAHGGVTSLEFALNGNLVSCGRDRTVVLWDQSGTQVRAFPALGDIAVKASFCDESNRVLAGDWTGGIRVWNAEDGAQLGEITPNPPRLEERLAAATGSLTAAHEQHDQLKPAYETARAEATKINADLEAAKKAATDAQAALQTAETAAKTAGERVTALTGERDNAAKVVAALEPVVPLLKESAEKAKQAAEKSPDDKELAEAVAPIQAQLDKKNTSLEAAKKTVADKNAELEKAQPEQTAADKQLADAKAALEAAQKRATDLEPAAKAAADNATAAKQAFDSAAQAIATAQADVSRWHEEIEYSGKLKVIAEHEAAQEMLELAAADAQSALEKVNADVAAANQGVADAQLQSEAAANAVVAAEKAVVDAEAAEAAVAKNITTLEGLLPALKEALAKGDEAVKKAPEDKDVIAAAAQFKSLLEAKTAALEEARKDQKAKIDAIAASNQAVVDTKKLAADAVAAIEVAQKKVPEVQAGVKPAEEQLAQAKAAADAAAKEVESLKAQLEPPQPAPTQTAAAN